NRGEAGSLSRSLWAGAPSHGRVLRTATSARSGQYKEGAMSKRPMYLQHVNIYVRNAERSKEWYEDLLGLHTYEYRPGWAAFMSADTEQSHEVALMQLGDDAPLQQKGQVGLNHMAWRLESLDDLKDFYQRIKAKGWPIEHISDHGISL